MIKIKEGKVKHNGKTYMKGDTLSGLSKTDEAKLISLGLAEKTEEVKVVNSSDKGQEKNVDEMKKIVESIDDVGELEALLKGEKEGRNRKTLISLLEDKINKLKEQDEDDFDDEKGSGNNEHSEDEDENPNLNINFNPEETIK